MTPRYVGLLRAINVGGNNKVPMAELRTVLASLGYVDVSTFIQSGNAIFTSDGSAETERIRIEAAIAKRFGFEVTVMLRHACELRQIVQANPFSSIDLKKLHVRFMVEEPVAALVEKLDGAAFAPEQFKVSGREVYLHLPDGMARTKLPAYLDRHLKIPATIRSWSTVTRLLELAGG